MTTPPVIVKRGLTQASRCMLEKLRPPAYRMLITTNKDIQPARRIVEHLEWCQHIRRSAQARLLQASVEREIGCILSSRLATDPKTPSSPREPSASSRGWSGLHSGRLLRAVVKLAEAVHRACSSALATTRQGTPEIQNGAFL